MDNVMRVQVVVKCAPHPREAVEAALLTAGKHLALTAESVSVEIDPAEPRVAVLEFAMRRAAQYTVVDDIVATIKARSREFYQDITVRFPKH